MTIRRMNGPNFLGMAAKVEELCIESNLYKPINIAFVECSSEYHQITRLSIKFPNTTTSSNRFNLLCLITPTQSKCNSSSFPLWSFPFLLASWPLPLQRQQLPQHHGERKPPQGKRHTQSLPREPPQLRLLPDQWISAALDAPSTRTNAAIT
jgi:hypothetical protein